jgi:hypothetical protein
MTDTLTPRDPWPILAAVLRATRPDALFSAAHWHDEAALAGLTGREIGAAMRTASKAGYLEPLGSYWGTQWLPSVLPAQHEKAKGRTVYAYRRTAKPFPGEEPWTAEVDGQLTLVEVP